jgi:hypothetical protein
MTKKKEVNRKDSAFRMRSKGGKRRALIDPARLSEIGRAGGLARSAKLSNEERSASARQAVTKRWDEVRRLAALAKKAGSGGRAGAGIARVARTK